jgi:hypothetical protein
MAVVKVSTTKMLQTLQQFATSASATLQAQKSQAEQQLESSFLHLISEAKRLFDAEVNGKESRIEQD